MNRENQFGRVVLAVMTLLFVSLFSITMPGMIQAETVLYQEDFEDGASDWYADNGIWQVGEATVGPVGAGNIAGTNLTGNYPYQANSRLISPWITLPEAPQNGMLWLRFSQWFNLHTSDGTDYGKVQIKTGPDNPWVDISGSMWGWSPNWSEYMADMAPYAGETVQIAFLIIDVDGGGYGHNESNGWYLNDVLILEGNFANRKLETFDDSYSWGGWYAENGCWQIGSPTWETYSGRRCAATNLSGNYSYLASSRLISPSFDLSAAPLDGQIWLSFWSWNSMSPSDGIDYGQVQIQVEGGSWEVVLQGGFKKWAGCWSPCTLDLSEYAGQSVRIAFQMVDVDGGGYGHNEAPGWSIDDVSIREGRRWVNNAENCDEGTITGWASIQGLWQMGIPTSGPGAAHSGDRCWGTNLSGNYGYLSENILQSTWIDLPTDQAVSLSFWHWYSFSSSDGSDHGYVLVSDTDGNTIMTSSVFDGYSGGWSSYISDLSAFAGQRVRVAFVIADVDGGGFGHYESSGWYIDDFELLGMESSSPPAPIWIGVTETAGAPIINYYANPAEFEQVCIYATKDLEDIPDLGNRIAILPAVGLDSYEDLERPGILTYYYHVTGIDFLGHEGGIAGPSIVGVEDSSDTPSHAEVVLHGSHPNPFNPTTTITFDLPQQTRVGLRVFDVSGRLVRVLLDGELVRQGRREVVWNGQDDSGSPAVSGIYLYRLEAGDYIETKRMTLLK